MNERVKLVLLYIKNFIFSLKTWLIIFSIPISLYFTKFLWKKPLDFFGATIYVVEYKICFLIAIIDIIVMFIVLTLLQKLAKKVNLNKVLFLVIFFSLLCLPAMKINKDPDSFLELRSLAYFQPLYSIENNKFQLNNNFGKDFEKAFNDRFLGRDQLIHLYRNTFDAININYNSDRVIVNKKSGWFFLKKDVLQTHKIPTESELLLMKENLNKFHEFCKSNGISVYYVITPEKSNIYEEFVPLYNIKDKDTAGRAFDRYLKVSDDVNFKYLFLEKEFFDYKKSNNQRLFFSTDVHYTNTAGYIIYKSVMKEIKKDYKDVKISDITDFNTYVNNRVNWANCLSKTNFYLGDLNQSTYRNEKYLDYEYLYYKPKMDSSIISLPSDKKLNEYKTTNKNGKYSIVLLGPSYIECTVLYFANSFKNVRKLRLNTSKEKNFHASRFEKLVTQGSPDILVVLISEGELWDYVSTMYDDTKELAEI